MSDDAFPGHGVPAGRGLDEESATHIHPFLLDPKDVASNLF